MTSKGARVEMIWCGYFSDDFQQKAFMTTAKAMAPSVRFHHLDGRKADVRFSIWSAADIFCSLSDNIQESFGLTVIEAMAAELPVVAANWDGYRDVIQHQTTGVLVDSYMPAISLADVAFRHLSGLDSYNSYIGAVSQFCIVDVEQTAQWIVTLAADPALRRKLGSAARQSVLKSYDWGAVLPQYRALWDEQLTVLDKARAAGSKPSIAWRNYDPALAFASFPSHRMHGGTSLMRGPHFELWEEIVKMPGTVVNTHTLVRATEFNALRAVFADGRSAHDRGDREGICRTNPPPRGAGAALAGEDRAIADRGAEQRRHKIAAAGVTKFAPACSSRRGRRHPYAARDAARSVTRGRGPLRSPK